MADIHINRENANVNIEYTIINCVICVDETDSIIAPQIDSIIAPQRRSKEGYKRFH